LAQSNIQDIRRLIYDLRPAILDELGLIPALREYVARYQKEYDLEVSLSLPDGSERLPALLETALFRVIQEALANVARHARARRLELALKWNEQGVSACITDDGQGFDLQSALAQARKGGHLGLWSMRERVEQLGGQFTVSSAPSQGTTVQFKVPIQAETGAWTKSMS
jgi:two-component system sensor histidine kinase DegS